MHLLINIKINIIAIYNIKININRNIENENTVDIDKCSRRIQSKISINV